MLTPLYHPGWSFLRSRGSSDEAPETEVHDVPLTLLCHTGPLAGRRISLRSVDGALWVAARSGDPAIVSFALERPAEFELPPGATLIGSYSFDRAREAIVWADDL
ncbi:MAG: hypothetical protein ABJD07_11265 [Gemmatimonadaceae bacterium]